MVLNDQSQILQGAGLCDIGKMFNFCVFQFYPHFCGSQEIFNGAVIRLSGSICQMFSNTENAKRASSNKRNEQLRIYCSSEHIMHYVLHSLTNFHNFTATKPLVPIHLLLIHFFMFTVFNWEITCQRQFYVCVKKKLSVFFISAGLI